MSEHARIQTPGVLVGLSVIDNLLIAAAADRRWISSFTLKVSEKDRAKAEDTLAKIGLSERRDALAGELSHGEVNAPRVLPTSTRSPVTR